MGSQRVRLTGLLVVALLVAALPSTASAQSEADAQRERDEIQGRRAEVAGDLDAAVASDADLEAAVVELGTQVEAQRVALESAHQAAEAADQELARISGDLEAKREAVAELEGLVEERAIDAYIHSGDGGSSELLLASDDLGAGAMRAAMVDQVIDRDLDVLDELALAREQLAVAETEATALADEAAQRRDDVAASVDGLESRLAEQLLAQETLRTRIIEFRGEADELAAEEAVLTEFLEEAAAQRAAEEAEARQAAEAAAAERTAGSSAPSSTTAPSSGSSTTAPPTAAAPVPSSSGGLVYPAAGTVTSGFGPRWGRMHQGLDISAPTGTPIVAAGSGTVIFAGTQGGYGLTVMIDHGGGLVTLYAHQSQIIAGQGQSVSAGEVIGLIGSTGHSTGPHLHFETRLNGVAQNPNNYL